MKNPPVAHGTRNVAIWCPLKSFTMNVPLTAAIGRQTPSTPETVPRCAAGTWSGSTADERSQHGVEEQLGDAPSEEHDRDVGRDRDDRDAEGAADHADDHPWPSHAQA